MLSARAMITKKLIYIQELDYKYIKYQWQSYITRTMKNISTITTTFRICYSNFRYFYRKKCTNIWKQCNIFM